MSRMAEPVKPDFTGIPTAAMDGRKGVYRIEMEQTPRSGPLDPDEIRWTQLRLTAMRGRQIRCEITLAGSDDSVRIEKECAAPSAMLERLGDCPRALDKFVDGLVNEARSLASGADEVHEGGMVTMGELFNGR